MVNKNGPVIEYTLLRVSPITCKYRVCRKSSRPVVVLRGHCKGFLLLFAVANPGDIISTTVSIFSTTVLLQVFLAAPGVVFFPGNDVVSSLLPHQDPNTGFVTNTPMEVFTMTPGRRYRFRLINSFGSVCPSQLTVEGHTMVVIASDGEPVQPMPVDTVISFSGERYDFVINANQPVGAYWIQVRGLGECGNRRVQQLAVLRYARGPYEPVTPRPTYEVGLPQGIVSTLILPAS